MAKKPVCINASRECAGPVEYRTALSGTGKSYPRCEQHWERRLAREEQLRARYPEYSPAADAAGLYD